jgi:hypothetical protein
VIGAPVAPSDRLLAGDPSPGPLGALAAVSTVLARSRGLMESGAKSGTDSVALSFALAADAATTTGISGWLGSSSWRRKAAALDACGECVRGVLS